MFMDPAQVPELAALSDAWMDIRAELLALSDKYFIAWPEKSIYDGNWTVFPLYKFGQKVEEHCALCPRTTRAIEGIPGLLTAGFSSLAPGTYIGPHFGYTGEVLRAHLGLLTPPDCAIRVGPETKSWTPGGLMLFDDTTEHEAWNRSGETRVVLLLDFKRDPAADVHYPEHVLAYGQGQ
ncbi:aspartyl/asparaginyl beta-hydroxylase domain-containing protein [Skermanella pratensis]|uniref:aspartyl/asparaginyl beta-hydroxylase domain-containing protein n=1 Tax=Skermanella pratensis TaxID=2233999 RepID=UPI001300E457|nr:aspartyl/asparaginyl beta-hydroxylase domain-containing protein [Skermanella pratensis]